MRRVFFSGIWGESITFWGYREQGAGEKHFRELGKKVIFLSGSREQRPPLGGGGWAQLGCDFPFCNEGGFCLTLATTIMWSEWLTGPC